MEYSLKLITKSGKVNPIISLFICLLFFQTIKTHYNNHKFFFIIIFCRYFLYTPCFPPKKSFIYFPAYSVLYLARILRPLKIYVIVTNLKILNKGKNKGQDLLVCDICKTCYLLHTQKIVISITHY